MTAIPSRWRGWAAGLPIAVGLACWVACGGGAAAGAAGARPIAMAPPGASAPGPRAEPLWPAAPIPSARPAGTGLGKLRAAASSADAFGGLDLQIDTATLRRTLTLSGPLAQRWAWVPFRAVTQPFGSPSAGALEGRAALVYVQDGRVWRLRPEGYDSAAPRQLSAASGVCRIDAVRPLDAAGNDAWIELSAVGPDGFCAAQGGAQRVWTRLDAAALDAPVPAPAALDEIDWLEDEYGSVRAAVVAATAGSLDVLHPRRLQKIGTVARVPAFTEARPLAALQRSLASWWVIDGRLHKLVWSDGRPALTVAGPAGVAPVEGSRVHVIDNELFMQSGRDWVAVASDGRVRALAHLRDGETVLAVEHQDGQLLLSTVTVGAGSAEAAQAWWMVSRSGVTARRLGDEPGQSLGYVGASEGEALFVRRWVRSGEPSTVPFFDRLEAHRLADGRWRVLEPQVDDVLPTWSVPTATASRPVAHLIYRVPLAAGVRNGAGRLKLLRSTLGEARDLMATPPQTQLARWMDDIADADAAYFNLSSTGSPTAVDLHEVLPDIDPPVRRLTQHLAR